MPGLGTSFGRGAATTPQWDLVNSDCIVVMGSNMAECHPVAYRFVMAAKLKGATIIHVDPRFTRTSAAADIYAPLRAGTDIAFLGGLINYVLQRDLFFKEYVELFTNASTLIGEEFKDTEDLAGRFSGLEREGDPHAATSWQYDTGESGEGGREPRRDPTLQHPRCVFQILKRHYARYTPEMVERVTGCPRATFVSVAEALVKSSGRERTSAFCYAVGWTQHTVGVQIIRACSILQLLLGNVGRPGGGVLALRGHSSIQGSTDIPTLYNLLPGYLPQPSALRPHETLARYIEAETPETGGWANTPAYIVSLLKEWYGEAASPDNDFCYDNLPKTTGDHSQMPMLLSIADGDVKGLFVLGQNPAVGGHNTTVVRKGLAQLDWMVVRDMFETDTAAFWHRSPEVERGDLRPESIKTEIFFLPAAWAAEKDGSMTNTHRLIQWHDKAVDPPGDSRSETWFMVHLGRRLKELYRDSPLPRDRAIQQVTWDYVTTGERGEPETEDVLRAINGYTVADRRQVSGIPALKDDGTTACGCWIYCGIFPERTTNRARSRIADTPGGPGTHLGWAYAWPNNIRLLYNRASADADGVPWSDAKRYAWWDEAAGRWVGGDTPDFPVDRPPRYEAVGGRTGIAGLDGRSPFVMLPDGKGHLFAPSGLQDGPLPTHYEPMESPVRNALYAQQSNPVVKRWDRPDNRYHPPGDRQHDCVITTYRLTEGYTGGTMNRWVPWLAELQPAGFIEMSTELAELHGLRNKDWVTLETERGEVEGRVLVTARLRPFHIDGRLVHLVGMPWHFGYMGFATGDVANDLSAIVADPNVSIHEGKVFTCNVRPGRLARRLP